MDIIDTLELGTVDGFDLRADLVADEDGLDGEYSPDAVLAYNEGEWQLVALIVTASRGGVDLGSDSIWKVEYGQFPTTDGTNWKWIDPLRDSGGSLEYYRADLVDNAIADARLKLTELVDAAIDDSID